MPCGREKVVFGKGPSESRRRRTRIYERIGRPSIGFYKDRQGRTRPITPRKTRYAPLLSEAFSRKIHASKPLLDGTVSYMLSQAPMVKELRTAHILADALYENWNSITQLYDTYEKRGWEGIADVIGSDITHDVLHSVQTDIAWTAINPFIPKEYHNLSKRILANVMDQVTSEEIRIVKQFMQQAGKQRLREHENRRHIDETEAFIRKKRKQTMRLPKEVNYV